MMGEQQAAIAGAQQGFHHLHAREDIAGMGGVPHVDLLRGNDAKMSVAAARCQDGPAAAGRWRSREGFSGQTRWFLYLACI